MIPQTPRARWRRRRVYSFLLAIVVVVCAVWGVLEPTGLLFVGVMMLGTVSAVLLLFTFDPNPIPPREDPRARTNPRQ